MADNQPLLDPNNLASNVITPEEFVRQDSLPTSYALTRLGQNPDEAGEAAKIGQATDTSPSLINVDLEHYQNQHKAALTEQLFAGNQKLRDYVAAHPFGADVSNDDWGQLDKISEHMAKFAGPLALLTPSIVERAAVAFAKAHGLATDLPVEEVQKLDRISTNPVVQGALMQMFEQVVPGVQAAHEMSRIFTGGLQALSAASEQWYLNRTGDQKGALKFARDMQIFPQMLPEHAPELAHTINKVGEAVQVAKPWADAGQAPPSRIHPVVLEGAKREARDDIKAFDELFKESQKSSTRGRDPESFKTFADLHFGDASIGISADKIAELYGDGAPEPGDNKLGWVPHIEAQFERARDSGYDVQVPWKDFLARATPEVYDALKDGIRVRHDGLTLDETKEAKPIKSAFEEEYGEPYKEGEKPKEKEDPVPLEPHESLAQAVGHGWESVEGGVEGKFLDLPEEGEPGKSVKSNTGEEAKSLSSFTLKDIHPKLNFDELPPDAKLLSEFWGKRLNELAGDVPIHVIDRKDFKRLYKGFPGAAGVYGGGVHQIVLPHDIFTDRPDWFASQVVLHEAGHAISVQELASFPELKDKVRQLMYNTSTHYRGDIPKELRYGFTNEKEFISEAIANPAFRRFLQDTPVSDVTAEMLKLGEKTGTIWDTVKDIIKDLWASLKGQVPDKSVMDAFFKIAEHLEEAGKVLDSMAGEDFAESFAESPEYERVFKNGRALGMNVARLEQYLKLAKDQLDRDAKLKRDQAEMEAGAKATKEWRDNEDRVREEVKADILARPDIAADRFLRTGELPNGESLQKVTLDPKAIDPQIRSRIPKEFLSERGVSPDDLAPIFAFQSGDQLVRSIARLNDERKLNDLTPAGHLKGLIDRETQRQMMERYGRSAQDIIDEAKEHVVGPTRMDILHAELRALGGDKPISAEMIKAQAKKEFDSNSVGSNNSDKFLHLMGIEGQKFEQAMLEGNGADAFKAKQFQIKLAHQAKLAMKLEKLVKSFDTRAERWARRAPPGVEPEGAVWLHTILRQIGFGKEIGLQDLERRKDLYANHERLREYVEAENKDPRGAYNSDPDAPAIVDKMPVADFLFSENYRNTVPEMTPPEFEAVFNSLKTIDHNSRNLNTALVRGQKQKVAVVVDGLAERLKAAVGGEPITRGEQKKSAARNLGSLLLNPETWFNRLDLGNRQGPFNQLIVRPLMEGQYELRQLEKKFARMWRDLGQVEDYNKKIENPGLWMDQRDGYAIEMHKGMAHAVLQNMGNELQRRKLLMGWGIAKSEAEIPAAEAKVWSWLQSVGIEEKDLDRAQKMGDIFSEAFATSEKAYTALSGVAPARIELHTFQTPWGEKREFYHPLIPDPVRYRHTPDINTLLEDGYHRPSPAAGYTKERTGAIYPLDLSLYSPAFRLKQVLNDAAMRVPITNVSKLLYRPAFQEAFAKYYGKEYQGALDAWIKDLAGNRQWVPSNIAAVNNTVVNIANNLSTLMIGWGLGTVLKHGPTAAVFSSAEVGAGRFAKHLSQIIGESFGSREAWKFAMENSEELQNRMHSMQESLSAVDRDLFPAMKGRFASFRETVQRVGAAPVGASDLISAVAMWNAEYERLSKANPDMEHGDLVYAANTAVRRTHGSSLLASRTALLRAGPFARAIMPFYNFFSNALQRNYEGAVFAKDRWQGKELPEMVGFDKETMEKNRALAAKVLLGSIIVYGVMPSIIESGAEQAIGQGDKKESWGKWGARSLLQAYPAQVPVVRDLMNYLEKGYDPSVGLYGTFARDVKDAISPKAWFKDPGTFLRKTNSVAGLLTGMNYDSVGRAGQFWLNVQAGKEHPKTPWEYWKGTMRGTLKERR